ncbi:MAG: PD-(D/E)XK nuclease family protein [Candidatus Binataceae bacterium]
MTGTLSIYPTAQKAEDVLKRGPGMCQWDEKIFTFPQLIDRLWRDFGSTGTILSPIGERLAVEQALSAAKNAQRTGLIARPGLITHILGLIRQLKRGLVSAEDLLLGAAMLTAPSAADRVREIETIFAEYEAILNRNHLSDTHSRERSVLDSLHAAESGGSPPKLLNGVRQLLVAEVYDFSLLQFMIISSLIRLIGDARITIQAKPHRVTSGSFLELTWNRFVAEPSIADQILPAFVRRDGRAGQLGFLLETLFNNEPHPRLPPADGSVRVIRAQAREAEIEEICRSIRRAVTRRNDPIPLDRIAIVARDLSPYARILESAFERYRLPLELHHGSPLIESAAIRAAIDILKIPLKGYRRDALDRMLALPYLTKPRSCRRILNQCGYLDEQTRPLKSCLDAHLTKLEERARAEQDPERKREFEKVLDRANHDALMLSTLAGALQAVETDGSISDHVSRFIQLLKGLDFDPARDAIVSRAAVSWTSFLSLLDEFSSAAGVISAGRKIDLEEFTVMVESAAAQITVSATASDFPCGGIRAFSVLDARGLDFDLVFIVGLNDKVFPRLHTGDPLLADETKIALARPLASAIRNRLGRFAPTLIGPVLRTVGDHSSEEWFLFFLALSMPAREAVLSFSTTDDNGGTISRSPFVEEILRLLDGNVTEETAHSHNPESDFEQCFAQGEFIAYAGRHEILPALEGIADDDGLQSIRARIAIERRREAYLSLPAREDNDGSSFPAKSELADHFNGRVVADERVFAMLLGTAAKPVTWSSQWFDHFAACGFRFFMRRVLRLSDEKDIPDYEASPRETGSLVHETLRELMSAGVDFSDRTAALDRVRQLLEEIGQRERLAARDPDLFDLAWEKIEMIAVELVDFEIARRAETPPGGKIAAELEFPVLFRLADISACLPDGRAEIEIGGRIDRLEFLRDEQERIRKVEVLDYKTSRSIDKYRELLDPKKEFGKTSFQIAVYLMGALAKVRDQLSRDAEVRGGYLVLRHRDKYQSRAFQSSCFEIDAEARQKLNGSNPPILAERMIALAAEAASARFDVDPLRCDDYCPYRRICRYYKPGYVP